MAMKLVDLHKLKAFALKELKSHPIIRDLILMEPDKVEVHEFLGKLPLWLGLLEKEGKGV